MHLRSGEEKCQSTFRSKIEDTREPVVTSTPSLLISSSHTLAHFLAFLLSLSLFLPSFPPTLSPSFSLFPHFLIFLHIFHASPTPLYFQRLSDSLLLPPSLTTTTPFLIPFALLGSRWYWRVCGWCIVGIFFFSFLAHIPPNGSKNCHTSQSLGRQVILYFAHSKELRSRNTPPHTLPLLSSPLLCLSICSLVSSRIPSFLSLPASFFLSNCQC